MDAIYDNYVETISQDDITKANQDLQETMRQEILYKMNEVLAQYNIEPRRG